MQRAVITLATVATVLAVGVPSEAQRGSGGGPKPRPTVSAPHTTAPRGGTHAQGARMKPAGGATSHGNAGAKATSPKAPHGLKTTANTATTTTGVNGVALTPAQQKLRSNTNLASRVASRLPAGTDVVAAAAGFRNLGQFVAAVNVSNNLGIPFADLKTSMVTDGKSLGQSIQTLRPTANAGIEARRAEDDAAITIRGTEATPTTTTSPKTKAPKKSKPHSGGGL